MANFSKRYIIKIPKNICILLCKKKKLVTFIGPLGKKSQQLKLKIIILKSKNFLVVTQSPFTQISGNEKKKLKSIQGTTIVLIKQIFLEVSFSAKCCI
jgi:ribosomal protein L6P/L9E